MPGLEIVHRGCDGRQKEKGSVRDVFFVLGTLPTVPYTS